MLKELEPLIAQYARSRQLLYSSLDGLTEVQADECLPDRDWSVKDTLVHIATNERLMTALLKDIADGTASELPADFDNQRFNDEQVALGHSKSIPQLRAELEASYSELIAALETITPEQIDRRGTHPAVGEATVKEFFVAMYAHHETHCRDVVEASRRLKRA
jgi:hypothetical protein